MTPKHKRTRLIFYLLAAYVFFQLSWWVYHLSDLHRQLRDAQIALVSSQPEIDSLHQIYTSKITMILGEGLVFISLLLVGIWYIRRNLIRDEKLAQQERNFMLAITHELKTPLASITLMLDTLSKRDLDRAKQLELLADARGEADRLDRLVGNVLWATRLEVDGLESGGSVQLSQLVEEVANRMNRSELWKNRIKFNGSEVAPISGDPTALDVLISNLVENALKYSPQDRNVFLEVAENEGRVELHVKDQGSGIPDEEKKLIFRKFYRVGNEDTRSAHGTGIGLYMVKKIADSHKALIKVGDNQPSGAHFVVSFPKTATNE